MPNLHVETLNCPMCGAATSTDAPRCQYCEARLATVACPACFATMFIGSKHCSRCGALAIVPTVDDSILLSCPRCKRKMPAIAIGEIVVNECERCLGLWLDVATFEKICADREQQSAVLGSASLAPVRAVNDSAKVSYVPCPKCSQLMNRINFARCSGVIVDICKGHGTWFDRDELSRIVEFIQSGGLEASREIEKQNLEAERRKLHEEQMRIDMRRSNLDGDSHVDFRGIAAARGLLKFLLGKPE